MDSIDDKGPVKTKNSTQAKIKCVATVVVLPTPSSTLDYLIIVKHLINVQNRKLCFKWLAKKDNSQFDAFELRL